MGTSQKPSFRFFRGLIFAIALAVFVYAGIQLFIIGKSYLDSRQSYHHIKETVEISEEKETAPEDRKIDFNALKNINSEAIGWLYVPAVGIDYPLMQTGDNDKYIHTTAEGAQQQAGAIFVDYRNRGDLSDSSTYIYGHHMKDKSMFSKLLDFKNKETYDKNHYIYIYRPEGTYQYEIFSVHDANALGSDYTLDFLTPDDFNAYGQAMLQKSEYQTGVSLTANDRLITLSTCSTTDLVNNDRFIVQAKLLHILSAS